MTKFDNYIYYSICEGALDYFKSTNGNDFRIFCDIIKNALLNDNYLSKKDKAAIVFISKYIERIYQLNQTEIAFYVTNFFLERKYLELHEIILVLSDYFKNSLL